MIHTIRFAGWKGYENHNVPESYRIILTNRIISKKNGARIHLYSLRLRSRR